MLIEEIVRYNQVLTEGVRITHIEDTVLERGIDGAKFALQQLRNLVSNRPENKKYLTIKYDGKPAVVFGRDASGQLMFTDKPRFVAKGYNGRATSQQELQDILMSRVPAGTDIAARQQYANDLGALYPILDAAIPKDFRGYILGDLMWSPTLNKLGYANDYYVFTPNTVTYRVHKDSDIGQQIQRAGVNSMGIAVHQFLPLDSASPVLLDKVPKYNQKSGLTMFTAAFPGQPDVALEMDKIDQLESQINTPANRASLHSLLDHGILATMRITDFPKVLQEYVNYRVDTGHFRNMAQDFLSWVESNPRLSEPKKQNITNHVEMHESAFQLLIKIFLALVYFKESLLQQLDSGQHSIQSSIGNQYGGEGYVYGEGDDKIKLIRRFEFSAENRRRYKQ